MKLKRRKRLSDADFRAGQGSKTERRKYEERLRDAFAKAAPTLKQLNAAAAEIERLLTKVKTKARPVYDFLVANEEKGEISTPVAIDFLRILAQARSDARRSARHPYRGSRPEQIRQAGVHTLQEAKERAPELFAKYARLDPAEQNRRLSDEIWKAWNR